MNIQYTNPFRQDGPLGRQDMFGPRYNLANEETRRAGQTVKLFEHQGQDTVLRDERQVVLSRLLSHAMSDSVVDRLTAIIEENEWFFSQDDRLRWYQGLEDALPAGPGETDPYALLSTEAIEEILMGIVGEDGAVSPLEFDQQVEVLAAYYAHYAELAARLYTGDEYDAAMGRLDSVFAEQLDGIIHNVLGYDKYMTNTRWVSESIKTLFTERTDFYSGLLRDGFTTGVEGTENEWANLDATFVASRLLSHAEGLERADSQAKYSVFDIKAMVIMGFASADATAASNKKDLEDLLRNDAWLLNQIVKSGQLSQWGEMALKSAFISVAEEAMDEFDWELIMREGERTLKWFFHETPGVDEGKQAIAEFMRSVSEKSLGSLLDMMLEGLQRPGDGEGAPDAGEAGGPAWAEQGDFFAAYVKLSSAMQYLHLPIPEEEPDELSGQLLDFFL